MIILLINARRKYRDEDIKIPSFIMLITIVKPLICKKPFHYILVHRVLISNAFFSISNPGFHKSSLGFLKDESGFFSSPGPGFS